MGPRDARHGPLRARRHLPVSAQAFDARGVPGEPRAVTRAVNRCIAARARRASSAGATCSTAAWSTSTGRATRSGTSSATASGGSATGSGGRRSDGQPGSATVKTCCTDTIRAAYAAGRRSTTSSPRSTAPTSSRRPGCATAPSTRRRLASTTRARRAVAHRPDDRRRLAVADLDAPPTVGARPAADPPLPDLPRRRDVARRPLRVTVTPHDLDRPDPGRHARRTTTGSPPSTDQQRVRPLQPGAVAMSARCAPTSTDSRSSSSCSWCTLFLIVLGATLDRHHDLHDEQPEHRERRRPGRGGPLGARRRGAPAAQPGQPDVTARRRSTAPSDYDFVFQTADPRKTWVRYCLQTQAPAVADAARLWEAESATAALGAGMGRLPRHGLGAAQRRRRQISNQAGGADRHVFDYECAPVSRRPALAVGRGVLRASPTSASSSTSTTMSADAHPGAARHHRGLPAQPERAADGGLHLDPHGHAARSSSTARARPIRRAARCEYFWFRDRADPATSPDCTPAPADAVVARESP